MSLRISKYNFIIDTSLLIDKKLETITVNMPSDSDDDFPLTQIKVYPWYRKKIDLVLTRCRHDDTCTFPRHYVHAVRVLKNIKNEENLTYLTENVFEDFLHKINVNTWELNLEENNSVLSKVPNIVRETFILFI